MRVFKEGETITAPLEASGVFPADGNQHGGRWGANWSFA